MIRAVGNEIVTQFIGDGSVMQNLCNRSAFSPVPSHSAEAKSFIGHILWSIRNRTSCKADSYTEDLNSSEIDPQFHSSMVTMENFNKADNSALKLEKLKNTISNIASQSFIMRLIYQICLFLNINITPEDLFLQKLQSKLKQGICFGVSHAILSQLRMNPLASSSDIMTKIQSERAQVISFQLLQSLNAQLNSDMLYLYLLLNPDEPGDLTHCPAKFLVAGKDERTLLYKAGKSLLEDIEKRLFPYKTTTTTFDTCQQAREALKREALKVAEFQRNHFMVNLFPKEGGIGHTLVLDLEGNRFYDQNSGFYEYKSRAELLTAFFDRIHAVYPDLETGTVDLVRFD